MGGLTSTALYKAAVIHLGYLTQNLTIPASTNRTLRLAGLGMVRDLGDPRKEHAPLGVEIG